MAKSKRKKSSSDETDICVELKMENNAKKKKKKIKLEVDKHPTSEPTVMVTPQLEGEGLEDLSPEELRVVERKLKKIRKKEEKKRLRAKGAVVEKVEPPKPSAAQLALDYLTCWAEDRDAWRFQKTRQTWLLQHMFDPEKIPNKNFPDLLSYVEGLCGAARDTTVVKAEGLVKELGDGPWEDCDQQRAHRAREVVQLLS